MTDAEVMKEMMLDTKIGGVAHIVPGMTDADRAADLKKKLAEVFGPVIAVMNDATASGLTITFQVSAPDGFGRHHLSIVEISRKL